MQTYVAFLRGINVGGKHKVPMADLRSLLEKQGYRKVKTVLNSGNVVFEAEPLNLAEAALHIGNLLLESFGFPVPVRIFEGEQIKTIAAALPEEDIDQKAGVQYYFTFIHASADEASIAKLNQDDFFRIIATLEQVVISRVDTNLGKSPDAMAKLEKVYGKSITTRNWNTLNKITALL